MDAVISVKRREHCGKGPTEGRRALTGELFEVVYPTLLLDVTPDLACVEPAA